MGDIMQDYEYYEANAQDVNLEGITSDDFTSAESYCSLSHQVDMFPPRQWEGMIIFLVVTGWLLAVIHKLLKKLDRSCRRMDQNMLHAEKNRQLHEEMQRQALNDFETLGDYCRRIDQNVGQLAQQISQLTLQNMMQPQAEIQMQLQAFDFQTVGNCCRRIDEKMDQLADQFGQLADQFSHLQKEILERQQTADARQHNTENYSMNMLKSVGRIDKNVRQLPQNISQLQAAREGDQNWDDSSPAVVDQDRGAMMDFWLIYDIPENCEDSLDHWQVCWRLILYAVKQTGEDIGYLLLFLCCYDYKSYYQLYL